jgi:hypothetical protein
VLWAVLLPKTGVIERLPASCPMTRTSLSEAQVVVAPELLAAVFARLYERASPAASGNENLRLTRPKLVIERTVWPVLPRTAWAFLAETGHRAKRGEPARRV